MSVPTRRPLFAAAALALAVPCAAGPARGDVVVLKAGGEVRGEFVGDPGRGGTIAVRTRSGAVTTVPRAAVRRWENRDAGREAFAFRYDRTPPTAEAFWDLGEWALARRLVPERERALRRVIELEPQHDGARRALRHKRDGGEWLSPARWRARRGLVLYGNRAVSPEEKALLTAADDREAAEAGWYAAVRLHHRALASRSRAGAGRAGLEKIDDPAAIPALRKFLSDDRSPAVRAVYVAVLSRLPGTTPVEALADQAMRDVDGQIRHLAVTALGGNTAPHSGPARAGAAQPLLRRGLRADENLTVRRAASALATVGDAHAVPDLIRSLVTTHAYKVVVPTGDGAGVALGPGGSVSGGLGAGGGGGLSPDALMQIQRQYPGATVRPPPSPAGPVRRVTVKVEHRNPEALHALRSILARTAPAGGAGFGSEPPGTYDEAEWLAWWDRNRVGYAAGA